MYQIKRRVGYSEIGADRQLTMQHLINYFQDCSMFQLEDLNLGFEYVDKECLACYFLSWQIEINRMPKFGEEVTIGTWIYKAKGFFGYRNFVLLDEMGETLAYANLCGCYVDTKTFEFIKLTKEAIAKYPIEAPLEMEYLPRKVKAPKAQEIFEPIRITQGQIDTNNHLNNSQYVAIALEFIPSHGLIKQVRVEYKKAARLKEQLTPVLAKEGQMYYVSLCDEQLEPYAIMSFLLEENHE